MLTKHLHTYAIALLCTIMLTTSVVVGEVCNSDGARRDCEKNNESDCEKAGCCWAPTSSSSEVSSSTTGTPWCFQKQRFVAGYNVSSVSEFVNGMVLTLTLVDGQALFGPDAATLVVNVTYETKSRLHVKISDPNSARFEIPASVVPVPPIEQLYTKQDVDYTFSYSLYPFGFAVTRKYDGVVMFNSTPASLSSSDTHFGGLIVQPQYMELSTHLAYSSSSSSSSSQPRLYGLAEHIGPLRLQLDQPPFTFWARDSGDPVHENIYGSHPYYMELRGVDSDGDDEDDTVSAHGVYLRNSNGMDVVLRPDYLQFRVIGGLFDLYFFSGPTPDLVTKQYQLAVGLPHMPPRWSLGLHQCRWGYKSVSEVADVVASFAAHSLPLDVMWSDIDYMNQYEDFTTDPINYPLDKLQAFIQQLHAKGQKYVQIIDPGIHNVANYEPFTSGLQQNVFVQRADHSLFTGKVWPGITAFPAWLASNTSSWWATLIANYIQQVPVSGLWIDMNEASNFCNGNCVSEDSKSNMDKVKVNPPTSSRVSMSSYPSVNDPPYRIDNAGTGAPLNTLTLDMDTIHGDSGLIEYDVHSLYGLMESAATRNALETATQQRAFVLSRSTFASAGRHTAHWLGDNYSTFAYMAYSIAGMLSFNLAGVPFVGADLCGFNGNTTEELCNRWMMLGAFSPFARNHNSINQQSQEPYRWTSVIEATQVAYRARYSLLPTLITSFARAHLKGGVVVAPLFYYFANDETTHDIDTQFMFADAILISPVLTAGQTSVTAYFPSSTRWYDYFSGEEISQSGWQTLKAPLSTIPVHVRGGFVLPHQQPALNTVMQEANNYYLVVALDEQLQASGRLFVDDGVTLKVGNEALQVEYLVKENGVTANITQSTFGPAEDLMYESVVIYGLRVGPTSVSLNGAPVSYSFNSQSKILLANFSLPLTQSFSLTWT